MGVVARKHYGEMLSIMPGSSTLMSGELYPGLTMTDNTVGRLSWQGRGVYR